LVEKNKLFKSLAPRQLLEAIWKFFISIWSDILCFV